MDRWTMAQMNAMDDIEFAIAILDERERKLCPYSPLALRIKTAQLGLRKLEENKND